MILADVGGTGLFAVNMEKMGFDIRDVDYATLSHAHGDHAGGIRTFFNNNTSAKFYISKNASENCYLKKFIFRAYCGIPWNVMSEYADRIELVSGDYRLCEGAWLIPHKIPGLEQIGRRESMYRRTAKGWVPDDFDHEQSLVLETAKGLVIVNCCSHGGVVNIINEVKESFPDKDIYGYIGGMHLFNKSEKEIRFVSKAIRETEIAYVCTGHCTKKRAYRIMKEELGDKLEQLQVGLEIEF